MQIHAELHCGIGSRKRFGFSGHCYHQTLPFWDLITHLLPLATLFHLLPSPFTSHILLWSAGDSRSAARVPVENYSACFQRATFNKNIITPNTGVLWGWKTLLFRGLNNSLPRLQNHLEQWQWAEAFPPLHNPSSEWLWRWVGKVLSGTWKT